MQAKHEKAFKASLRTAHAALLRDATMAVLSARNHSTLWQSILSTLGAAHVNALLCLNTAAGFKKVQLKMLHAIDAVARELPGSGIPSAVELLCRALSRPTAAPVPPSLDANTTGGAGAAVETDPRPRALQLLPTCVAASAEPDAAAAFAAPFVVRCLGAPATAARAAAVDAIAAMKKMPGAAEGLAPIAAVVVDAAAAVAAAPGAFLEHLASAQLSDEGRAAAVVMLQAPFRLASAPSALRVSIPEASGAADAAPRAAGSFSLADVAFEAGMDISAVRDACAALAVFGAPGSRFIEAAIAVLDRAAEPLPCMHAFAPYVCRNAGALLREGHDAGELLGLARDALRGLGRPTAGGGMHAAAVAAVRIALTDAAAAPADVAQAGVRHSAQVTSSLRYGPLGAELTSITCPHMRFLYAPVPRLLVLNQCTVRVHRCALCELLFWTLQAACIGGHGSGAVGKVRRGGPGAVATAAAALRCVRPVRCMPRRSAACHSDAPTAPRRAVPPAVAAAAQRGDHVEHTRRRHRGRGPCGRFAGNGSADAGETASA